MGIRPLNMGSSLLLVIGRAAERRPGRPAFAPCTSARWNLIRQRGRTGVVQDRARIRIIGILTDRRHRHSGRAGGRDVRIRRDLGLPVRQPARNRRRPGCRPR